MKWNEMKWKSKEMYLTDLQSAPERELCVSEKW